MVARKSLDTRRPPSLSLSQALPALVGLDSDRDFGEKYAALGPSRLQAVAF